MRPLRLPVRRGGEWVGNMLEAEMSDRKAATAEEICSITGEVEDSVLTSILATGATSAEVLEAFTWLNADDALRKQVKHPPQGVAGDVYEILAAQDAMLDEG